MISTIRFYYCHAPFCNFFVYQIGLAFNAIGKQWCVSNLFAYPPTTLRTIIYDIILCIYLNTVVCYSINIIDVLKLIFYVYPLNISGTIELMVF